MAGNSSVIGLENTWGLIGNPLTAFNALNPDAQGLLTTITGLAAFVFLIVTILTIMGHGTASNLSSLQKDSHGRSHHMMGIIFSIVTVILVLFALAMVFSMYS